MKSRTSFALIGVAFAGLISLSCGGDDLTGSPGDSKDPGGPPEDANALRVPQDFPTIQAGIDVAEEGETILVAVGTYTGSGNKNLDFGGKGLVLVSEDGADATVIDCEWNGRGLVFRNGETAAAVVDGFTIRNGSGNRRGGAVWCEASSSPAFIDCTIANSRAEIGAGIHCWENSNPTFTDCTISGNVAVRNGGRISCSHSNPTFTDCTIRGNKSTTASGGGFNCFFASPILTNCTITENISYDDGAGLHLSSASHPTLTLCTITGNSALKGGGFSCSHASSPMLVNCMISGNIATHYGGGAAWHDGSHPVLMGCTITANTSGTSGGGISCWDNSDPTLTNCSIVGNMAVDRGGGISCWDSSSPTLSGTILWDDTPDEVYVEDGSEPTLNYCDVQGGYAGGGNIDADPLFVDPGNGDYHLGDGSPCIDTGLPSVLDACLPPGLGTTLSDMGAYGGTNNCGW